MPCQLRWVVRVHLPLNPYKLYSYRCWGCRHGDLVEIDTPLTGCVTARVEGFGRKGWLGRLKRARRVQGDLVSDEGWE